MKDIVHKLQDSLEYEFNLSFSERKQLLERVKEDEKVKETLNNMVRERQIKIDKAIECIIKREWGNCEDCVNQVYDILEGEDND